MNSFFILFNCFLGPHQQTTLTPPLEAVIYFVLLEMVSVRWLLRDTILVLEFFIICVQPIYCEIATHVGVKKY